MKRYFCLIIAGCCILAMLSGCGGREDPYRIDTVVRIPVDPTQVPTETVEAETLPPETQAPEETAAPTEATRPSSGGKGSGGKTNSGSKGTESTRPAAPPATEAPETRPEETLPDFTNPPEILPDFTNPPETLPDFTNPPETEPAPTEAPFDPSGYQVGSLEFAILAQVNAYRAEAGLPELSMSTRLCGIAAVRAREIEEYWSHSRPDGRDGLSVLSDYGVGYSVAAENLTYVSGSEDAAAIAAGWMNGSDGEKLLGEGFTTAGIGVYRSGGMTYIANLLIG